MIESYFVKYQTQDRIRASSEINLRMKQEALDACQPPISAAAETFPRRPIWRDDAELLKWLKSI
jgi:hypothetical protein